MLDLSVKYMGLQLKNPIIAGSSSMSQTVDDCMKLEDSGVAAIVMKSLFEEQIYIDAACQFLNKNEKNSGVVKYFETVDYINNRIRREYLSSCLKTINNAKQKVQIPVIASINCISSCGWTTFASKLQDAGADAIELNIAVQSFDPIISAEVIEDLHLEIIEKVRASVKIPVAVKISPYFSNISNMINSISAMGVDGIVMFNRFINPDIDVESMEITVADRFSSPSELSNTLRWIALKSDDVPCDLCAATGIHSGKDVIKILLVGGAATQIVSTFHKNGLQQVEVMLDEIKDWMQRKGYNNISEFAGKMRHMKTDTPASYERIQFMKYNHQIDIAEQ